MPIFNDIDINNLGDSPIEQAIKSYKYAIAGCYVGTLNNGNNYALIIDTSDEWIHVIAYNRAAVGSSLFQVGSLKSSLPAMR